MNKKQEKNEKVKRMPKEIFVKIIEKMIETQEAEEAFNAALDAYDEGEYHCFLPSSRTFDKVGYVALGYTIGFDMCEPEDDELFGWWVYDLEFGRNKSLKPVIKVSQKTSNGETKEVGYDVSSPSAFYDFVTEYVLQDKEGEEYSEKK